MSQKQGLLVVGSVALDTVETAQSTRHEILGGSAAYFAAAASFFGSVSLVAVVGLAKQLAPAIERAVAFANAPPSLVGILIALLVLLPETQAALGAALRNRMQTSLNLALGSALATIGLTIPSVVAVALWMDLPLILGLPPKEIVLLTLTLVISTMTLASGRATLLQGAVHLVVFAAFLFLAIVP